MDWFVTAYWWWFCRFSVNGGLGVFDWLWVRLILLVTLGCGLIGYGWVCVLGLVVVGVVLGLVVVGDF